MTREPRWNTDADSRDYGGATLIPVVLMETARPKKTFQVKVRSFSGPPREWDPDDSESEEGDLWTITDETISNVRYGLRSNDTLEEGIWGWVAYWQGRPFLIIAECG